MGRKGHGIQIALLVNLLRVEPLGVSDLSRQLGVNVSTLHYWLKSEKNTVAVQDEETKKWKLGNKVDLPNRIMAWPNEADITDAVKDMLLNPGDHIGRLKELAVIANNHATAWREAANIVDQVIMGYVMDNPVVVTFGDSDVRD